jgi:G:T-mismatch repair DNA endonuclease (very short patch repair protein)
MLCRTLRKGCDWRATFSKAKRSAVMAAIRGRGNKDTELRMMALLRALAG